MKETHNKNKIYVRGLGYQDKDYQTKSVLGFLRVNFIFITLMASFSFYRHLNTPSELLNPFISINEVQAKEVIVEPTPEPSKCLAIENEIEQYICEVFGDEYENAMSVLSCENKTLNPNAINDQNSNGSIDVGIFQINSIHGFTVEEMKDWKANVDFAYKLMKRDGWSAWACSHKIGVTPFYLK